MVPTVMLNKRCFRQLPDEALRLVGMGQYTLYRVKVAGRPEIQYVLRTGPQELFFLTEEGQPLALNEAVEFDIEEKISLEDVPVFSVVPNLNRF